MPSFIKQAAAAKAIGVLSRDSSQIASMLLKIKVIQQLLYAMGNVDYADSQRQAALTLEVQMLKDCVWKNKST